MGALVGSETARDDIALLMLQTEDAVMTEHLLTVRRAGSFAVAELPKDVDATNTGHIREELAALIAGRPPMVVVDMTRTTFCDSSGVATLVRLAKDAASAQVAWRVAVSDPVLRVMHLIRADQVMEVYGSLAAALGEESSPGPRRPGEQGGPGQRLAAGESPAGGVPQDLPER